jgi:DNA-binding MarR family transcriptional regulator
MMAIVRASELFKRKSSAIFAQHGLSFSQYNVLRLLEGCPEGKSSISEIADKLLVSTPNLSGIAKRLEKAGFVSRTRDQADERKTILILKKEGQKVLARVEGLQMANIREFLADWPDEQKDVFLNLLKHVLQKG